MKLPSGTSYYTDNVVEFTTTGEIGVMPMTGKDELLLKNPDALLNGEALVEIINSCVPAVKKATALLTNDIDALITAIRFATYEDTLETELVCPSCGTQHLFKLDLQYSIDNMTYLEKDYVVNLDSGVSIFVKPYGFPELLKGLHAQFEQSKISRSIANEEINEDKRMKMFSDAFKEMIVITRDLLCNSVIKVVDENNNINVTDRAFIAEFLNNINKTEYDKISDLIKEINLIGIKRSFIANCDKCGHSWESEIDFNPVNFS
jgi:rubrerythrin